MAVVWWMTDATAGARVATAMLLREGLPVVSQCDFATLAKLRALWQPGYVPPDGLRDHQQVLEHLSGPHPRADVSDR